MSIFKDSTSYQGPGLSLKHKKTGWTRHLILVVVFCFISPFALKAEINVVNSIEWLVCHSDLVIRGNITFVDMKGDKLTCTIEISEGLKGPLSVTTLDFSMPMSKTMADRLKKIMVVNRDVIVFLKNNNAGKKKMPADYSPIRDDGTGLYYVVDLTEPMNMLISAGDFKVLKEAALIISKCKAIAAKANAITDKKKNFEFKKYYLNVPAETEAYYAIYSGSSCYLFVPETFFPAAKPDIH